MENLSNITLEEIVKQGVKLTPMMQQYYEIKKQYEDHLLLFRMGDFYEVFFEDAINAAKILNIARTHRGKLGDHPIPMAGIPHHAAAAYVDRITNHGLKVAICEQVEDPKEAKGIVKRAVTQVVSPGMPYDLEKTESSEHRYMASGQVVNGKFYLSAIDFTTGEFTGLVTSDFESFLNKLRMIEPKEFIAYLGQWDEYKTLDKYLEQNGILKTHLSSEYFEIKYTELYTERLIPAFKRDQVIKANEGILGPVGALSYYVCSTQSFEEFYHIRPFRMISDTGHMKVTLATLTGLEILPKTRDTYKDSLLGFFDKTQTSLGARMLKNVFLSPLNDLKEIGKRHTLIQHLIDNDGDLKTIREKTSDVRDLERIMAKATTGKANAGDLLNISTAINVYEELLPTTTNFPVQVTELLGKDEFKLLKAISDEITSTINDEIGATLEKGNLIKNGSHKERDRLAKLTINAAEELLQLETRYREETGLQKLKIKSNNVTGYFIEVSKTHSDKVPASFIRRQTLVNSERYTTDELNEFEKEIITAKDKLERLEREIFKNIILKVADVNTLIMKLADIIATFDVFQSFAWIALQEEFTCPKLSDKKKEINLQGAWHPLIKSIIRDQFVPHDLKLDDKVYFGLITGPNMAGKTTVMREVAIVQLLAQIGSFVPAQNAELGLCDYLFSRLGASDDILKGQSTFMVEMAETAEIIRHATEKSLIILDEVGRGTSTYDGMSIAWALVEHFVKKTKALCLFATHYHELIDLADKLPEAKNLTVETANNGDDVQFLYRLIETGASQSFGIYVAKLAGLPHSILNRSTELLEKLESNESSTIKIEHPVENSAEAKEERVIRSGTQLSFFSDIPLEPEVPKHLKNLEKNVLSLDINNMTPLQAIVKLDELKQLLH